MKYITPKNVFLIILGLYAVTICLVLSDALLKEESIGYYAYFYGNIWEFIKVSIWILLGMFVIIND